MSLDELTEKIAKNEFLWVLFIALVVLVFPYLLGRLVIFVGQNWK